MRISAVVVVLLAFLTNAASFAEGKRMDWVVIGKDGKSFALESTGKVFVPRGFNYDRDHKMRLIEDYWDAEWSTVEQDFAEMKKLGANVVRVHLQFGKFMQSPGKCRTKALDRLGRLVELAESMDLYLDLTGLGCYRKTSVPAWYNRLTEAERWRAQAVFWGAVAAKCAGHPSVFCYDLMNEPVVPAGRNKPGAWLGSEFAGFCYVQFIALDQQDRSRPKVARDWLRTMTAAIRKHDKRGLITVGLVDWSLPRPGITSGFVPKTVVREVDFLSVHIYPESGKIPEALETLKGFAVGKPVIIEETFPMHCSIAELRQFLTDSEQYAAGWMGFYWGKTLKEYRQSDSLPDAVMAGWLEMFEKEAKQSAPRKKP